MALTAGVASVEWETALYKLLIKYKEDGGYINAGDFRDAGVSTADVTAIKNGLKAYILARNAAGVTKTFKQPAKP